MNILNTIATRLKYIILYGYYIPTQYYAYPGIKLVYIPVPKVACTSIKCAIDPGSLDNNDGNYDAYMDIHSSATREHERLSLHKINDYYKIAFVRNPFDRIVSCYEDKVLKGRQHTGRYFFSSDYNNILIKRLYGTKFHSKMSFTEFVCLVSRIPDLLSDAHFRSQYSFLYKNGKKVPDYIGKFENLPEDWQPVAKKFKLNELGMKNKSTRESWAEYYTSRDIVDLVANRYSNDIDAFDYRQEHEYLLKKVKT